MKVARLVREMFNTRGGRAKAREYTEIGSQLYATNGPWAYCFVVMLSFVTENLYAVTPNK